MRYWYRCGTCGDEVVVGYRIERFPGLIRQGNGFKHYHQTDMVVDEMSENDEDFAAEVVCGPMKRVWTFAGIEPMGANRG